MNGTVAENQKTRLVAGDILRRAAERFPDRHAFTFLDATGKEEQISYRDLNEQVNRAANALSEKGIQKGDRVVAVGRNSPEFVIMAFAAMKLGAWITPLNFMLNSAELARLIEAARPAAIFAAGDSIETVRAGDWPAEEVNVLI
ncbi:AMP-binding protein [Edaphobacillus lindanitolerans]|nr:AMP-binding protein [Edaphobacillus lindanitolerans]